MKSPVKLLETPLVEVMRDDRLGVGVLPSFTPSDRLLNTPGEVSVAVVPPPMPKLVLLPMSCPYAAGALACTLLKLEKGLGAGSGEGCGRSPSTAAALNSAEGAPKLC